MFDLSHPDSDRIERLARCSEADAREFGAEARLDNDLATHCARLCLAIVFDVSLAGDYLRDLVARLAENPDHEPAVAHACCLALLNSNTTPISIPEDSSPLFRREIDRASGLRLGLVSRADDEIVRLAADPLPHNRRIACWALAYRAVPDRLALLQKLIADPERSVSRTAAGSCFRIGEPAFSDLVFQHGDMFHLRLLGDSRARAVIASLVTSDNPVDADEAISCAHRLGDRDLIAQLWPPGDWYRQRRALLRSVHGKLLTGEEVLPFVETATAEQLAELIVHWPEQQWAQVTPVADRFRALIASRPDVESDVLAAPADVRSALIRMASTARRTVLVEECLRDDDPEVQARVIEMIGTAELIEPFERDVLAACIHTEADVASAAVEVITRCRYARGLFGIDTAILTGRDISSMLLYQTSRLLTPSLEQRSKDLA